MQCIEWQLNVCIYWTLSIQDVLGLLTVSLILVSQFQYPVLMFFFHFHHSHCCIMSCKSFLEKETLEYLQKRQSVKCTIKFDLCISLNKTHIAYLKCNAISYQLWRYSDEELFLWGFLAIKARLNMLFHVVLHCIFESYLK